MSSSLSQTNQSTLKALRSNSNRVAWLVAEKILLLVSSFFVGVWVVRTLGPVDFGRFSIALSVTAVLASVATVGLDTVLLRRFTSQAGDARASLVAAVSLRVAGALVHLMLCFLAAHLFFKADSEAALVTLIVSSAALFRVMDVVGLRLQADDRYPLAASIRVLARIGGDLLRIGMIMVDASVIWFALTIVAESVISACLFAIVERATISQKISVDWALARAMLRDGWPIAVSGVLAGLYARIDQAVVFSAFGAETNGQYAAAARVSELFNLLCVSIAAVAAPHFAGLKDATDIEFEERLRTYFRLMVLAGACIALAIGLLAGLIMQLLYGPAFLPAAQVLRVHAWSIPMVFASVAMEPWFYHYGKLDLYVLKTALALVVAVPLVVTGAYMFGSLGVALAVVTVYAFSVFATNAVLPKARGAFRFQAWALFGIVRRGAR